MRAQIGERTAVFHGEKHLLHPQTHAPDHLRRAGQGRNDTQEIISVKYSRYDPNSRSGNRMFDIHVAMRFRCQIDLAERTVHFHRLVP